jgi:hypothetical protein
MPHYIRVYAYSCDGDGNKLSEVKVPQASRHEKARMSTFIISLANPYGNFTGRG